jgi:membrane-associated protease RseP (regulator of RpoE activity)
VSTSGSLPADYASHPPWQRTSVRHRYWLHLLLLAATLLTTTAMGARLALNFEQNVPPFSDSDLDALSRMVANPATLVAGLPFSLTLLGILLAHEMGHYFACVHYGVNASLPYFLPAPTLIGTLGAFIRIRSPIYSKPMLFDIGISGPLAGFLFLLPAFAIGLAYSKIIPGIAQQGDFLFGAPLLQRLLEAGIFPGTPGSDIYLHPIARAAWVGVLATALNLLPIGQLDGGHILYAFAGVWHKVLSRIFVVALVPIGLLYSYSWLLWALFLLLFGMRHPPIYDFEPLGRGRRRLGLLALLIFLLSFTLAPVSLGEGLL